MYKTENEIWAFLVSKFNAVLAENDITGWTVLRNYQPSIQGLKDKCVYLYKVNKRRVGTQGITSVKDDNGDWQSAENWFEEIMFQVSAFCKREPSTETTSTITSEDVLDILLAYVNSALKVPEWRTQGYGVIKATNIRCMDYETDSGLQEKLPQFDFLLCIEQNKLKKIGKFDTVEIETKRV